MHIYWPSFLLGVAAAWTVSFGAALVAVRIAMPLLFLDHVPLDRLPKKALASLQALPGVDGIVDGGRERLIVVAEEHGRVDWKDLLTLAQLLGIDLVVRAHQGRPMDSLGTVLWRREKP